MCTTCGCGRLFDAVSSLLGVCHINTYEGEAAMRLEALVQLPQFAQSLFCINQHNQLNLQALLHKVCQQENAQAGSELFHGGLIETLSEWLSRTAKRYQLKNILLSGGCLQNTILRRHLTEKLKQSGFAVYISQQVPVNDGGISLGQAWVANSLKKSFAT